MKQVKAELNRSTVQPGCGVLTRTHHSQAVTNIQEHWQQMFLMMPIHIFLLIFHTRLVSICK